MNMVVAEFQHKLARSFDGFRRNVAGLYIECALAQLAMPNPDLDSAKDMLGKALRALGEGESK